MGTRIFLKPFKSFAAMLGVAEPVAKAWRRFLNSRRYRELAPKPLASRDCPCSPGECPSMGCRAREEKVGPFFSSTAYRCGKCGLVYFDPQPDAATLTRFYSTPGDDGYAALLRGWTARDLTDEQRGECRSKLEQLHGCWRGKEGSMADHKPKFVEIGIGNAHLLAVARDVLGWKVQGIDVSHPLAEDARKTFGLDILEHDLSLPESGEGLPSGVDIVLAEHTLEHTRHPGQVLKNIAAMLAPGGIAAVMVPSGESLQALHDFRGWAWGNYPEHLYFFTRKAFEMSFTQAGLVCEQFDSADYDGEGEQRTRAILQKILKPGAKVELGDYLPALRKSLLLPELSVIARKAMPT